MSARRLEAAKRVSKKLLAMSSDELRTALDAQEGSFYKKMFDRFFDLSREMKQSAAIEVVSASKAKISSKEVKYSYSVTIDKVADINPDNEEHSYGPMAA